MEPRTASRLALAIALFALPGCFGPPEAYPGGGITLFVQSSHPEPVELWVQSELWPDGTYLGWPAIPPLPEDQIIGMNPKCDGIDEQTGDAFPGAEDLYIDLRVRAESPRGTIVGEARMTDAPCDVLTVWVLDDGSVELHVGDWHKNPHPALRRGT